MRRRSFSVSLPFLACVAVACAGPVSAALTVEIVRPPTDPFQAEVGVAQTFEAVAYMDGQELESGAVDWQWTFGDDSEPSPFNPTCHAYTEIGTFLATVTATYSGQQAHDTVTMQVEEGEFEFFARPPWGDPVETPEPQHFEHQVRRGTEIVVRYGQDTMVNGVRFWMKPPASPPDELTWRCMGGPELTPRELPDGRIEWIYSWDTMEPVLNADHEWKAVLGMPGEPAWEKTLGPATWEPFNIVQTERPEHLIFFDPDDPQLDEFEIGWYLDELIWPPGSTAPTHPVYVYIFNHAGSRVWRQYFPNQEIRKRGTFAWQGQLSDPPEEGPPVAPRGVYTFDVKAGNQPHPGDPDWFPHSIDAAKSWRWGHPLVIENPQAEILSFDARTAEIYLELGYTLNCDAGDCVVTVYNPQFDLIGEKADLDPSAGQHSSIVVHLTLNPFLAGTYYVMYSARETDRDGFYQNRDQQVKIALQKGVSFPLKPRAWGVPGGGRWAFAVARNCVIRACYQGGDWGDKGWLRREWPAYGENPGQFPPPGYNSSCLTQPTDAETIYYRLNDLLENGQDNPKEDAVFFYMGHGEPNRLLPDQYDPGFTILWGEGYANQPEEGHYCIDQMVGDSLDRCVLAVPLACDSKTREPFKGSVQGGLRAEGVDCVLGFDYIDDEFAAKAWSDAFWKYLCGLPDPQGKTHVTVAAAHEAALDAIEGEDKGGMETCTFLCQDGVSETTLQIRPARWGQ